MVLKLTPAEFTFQLLLLFTASMLVHYSEPVQGILFGKVSLEWLKRVGSMEKNHSIAMC